MRICFLTNEYTLKPPFGGIATYTRDAARWMARHGHRAHVVLVSRTGPYKTMDDHGVKVHVAPPRRIRPRRILRTASRIPGLGFLFEAYAGWDLIENSCGAWLMTRSINKIEPLDLIETADYSGLGFWRVFPTFHTIPVVVRGHGILALAIPEQRAAVGAGFHYILERFTARHADFVLTNSTYMAQAYQQEFGVPSERVGVHRLPFSHTTCKTTRPHIRRSLGWAETDPIVLFVGRLEKQKGIDVLLQAVMAVHRQLPDLKVVLLGQLGDCPRSLYDELLSQAKGWVHHPGAVDSATVRSMMLRSNILVLPSRIETMGRVLVEAQLAGLPVVATRVGGIPEAMVEGITGLLVDPDDVDGLSQAITTLCQCPEMRDQMGQEALRWATARFNVSTVMSKQVEVYRALQEDRSVVETLEQEVC